MPKEKNGIERSRVFIKLISNYIGSMNECQDLSLLSIYYNQVYGYIRGLFYSSMMSHYMFEHYNNLIFNCLERNKVRITNYRKRKW